MSSMGLRGDSDRLLRFIIANCYQFDEVNVSKAFLVLRNTLTDESELVQNAEASINSICIRSRA